MLFQLSSLPVSCLLSEGYCISKGAKQIKLLNFINFYTYQSRYRFLFLTCGVKYILSSLQHPYRVDKGWGRLQHSLRSGRCCIIPTTALGFHLNSFLLSIKLKKKGGCFMLRLRSKEYYFTFAGRKKVCYSFFVVSFY